MKVDDNLLKEACKEMRRPPPGGNAPHVKRQKTSDDGDASRYLISVNRFNYDAPQLLKQGGRGILLTCTMRNERTATKESLAVLQHYLPASIMAPLQAAAAQAAAQQPAATAEAADKAESATAQPAAAQPAVISPFNIVKVGCTGVIMLLLNESAVEAAKNHADGAPGSFFLTQTVQKLAQDFESKKIQHFRHCQRVIPLEQTCLFDQESLEARAAAVAKDFLASPLADAFKEQLDQDKPVTYAVGFKNRETNPHASTWNGDLNFVAQPYGKAETGSGQQAEAATGQATESKDSEQQNKAQASTSQQHQQDGKAVGKDANKLRLSVLKVVANAFSQAMPWKLAVDLKAPQLVLMVEIIPAHGQMYAGLALIPGSMCTTKPKIGPKSYGPPAKG